MCGIYGTTISYEDHQVKAKLERILFRGPDKSDYKSYQHEGSRVTLGHNRLSIIDLDPRSNQPLTYYNNIHIVFNGEIYNFKDFQRVSYGNFQEFIYYFKPHKIIAIN